MSTKVKGILKGLRYISQIFDEKEEEIQIGFPTDVKHVAHIGSDDPSANAPSWMGDFKTPKEGSINAPQALEEHQPNSKEKPSKTRHLIPKSRHQSIDTEANTAKKHTRRHHRASDPSADSSSTHDSSSGGSRHRRHRRGSNHGSDSSSQEAPASGSKHGHRRKSKNSEDGGSVRKPSSRRSSKGDSLTEISLSEFGSGESGSGLAR